MRRKHESLVGTTIKNFELLDYKIGKSKNGAKCHYYFIHCLLCGNERWMRHDSIIKPLVISCGCYNKKIISNDLSGQIFGHLTALAPTEKRDSSKRIVWDCKCSCGEKTQVASNNLVSGVVKSCGCRRKREDMSKKDLSGQTFDRLTALAIIEKQGSGPIMWDCKCLCGKRKQVKASDLVHRNVRSCGCLIGKDISGQTFGRLTAISSTDKRNTGGSIVWNCKCSCGVEKQLDANALLSGNVKSCGCLQSETSVEVANRINEKYMVEGTSLLALTKKKSKTNKSGIKGVFWNKSNQKWKAKIGFKGKSYDLGSYENIEDAITARKNAEDKFFRPVVEKYKDQLSLDQVENSNLF